MTIVEKLAEQVYEYLRTHPNSSRLEIEMALQITYDNWVSARHELGKRIEFARTKEKGFVFSVKGERHV